MGKLETSSRPTPPWTITLSVYPLIVGLLGIAIASGLIGQAIGRFSDRGDDGSWVDPSRLPAEIPPAPVSVPAATTPTPPPIQDLGSATTPEVFPSNFRVSNRTTHPVRVTVMTQALTPPESAASPTDAAIAPGYEAPAHWDFAPEEGSQSGLLLSLPDQALALQSGDIVVAFAQDGSRLYWGPYVVGATSMPHWDPASQEWQFILTP